MERPYIPISCNFHDILLDRSTRQKDVRIIYSHHDERLGVNGIIEDVFTKDKVELLKVKAGPTIRLDQLISVDDEVLSDYTTC